MIRKTLRNATAAILIRQECKAAGLDKGIPLGAVWGIAKWLFQQLAFNPKYEDPESQEGQRAAVLALAGRLQSDAPLSGAGSWVLAQSKAFREDDDSLQGVTDQFHSTSSTQFSLSYFQLFFVRTT